MAAERIKVVETESEEPKRPVAERVVRRFLEHPIRFPVAALLIGLGISLLRHRVDDPATLLGVCAMFVLWLPLWVNQRARDPSGRHPFTIIVGVAGSLIMGWLVSIELGLSVVPLAMMPQYFITLPFPVAIICGIPAAIGSEYSHRLAVFAAPNTFPWALAIVRSIALMAIRVSFM